MAIDYIDREMAVFETYTVMSGEEPSLMSSILRSLKTVLRKHNRVKAASTERAYAKTALNLLSVVFICTSGFFRIWGNP